MNYSRKRSDFLVIGFALFSMFFGAGSLLFPPYLGMEAGTQWILGFFLFFLSDVGLAFVTMVAMIHQNGNISGVTGTIGKRPALILNTTVMVCIGPLLAIPRTAATTFEMSILPLFPSASMTWMSVLFFALVFVLTIRPSRVVDILGKFLTPLMVAALAVLIVVGVLNPLGPIAPPVVDSVVSEGIINGYQAMDVLGALRFSMVICSAVTKRGYVEEKDRVHITSLACILAGELLFATYCGLTYLGATYSTIEDISQANQARLIIRIIERLLGYPGILILGVIVGLACLTTAIGLVSSSAAYFEQITKGKVTYPMVVAIVCVFSTAVSSFGLSAIISIATPILSVVYPVVVCLIVLSFFKEKLTRSWIYKGAALTALVVSILTVGASYGLPFDFINFLPLSGYQLNWILPAVIGGIAGSRITDAEK